MTAEKRKLRKISDHFKFKTNPFLEGDLTMFAVSFMVMGVGFTAALLINFRLWIALGAAISMAIAVAIFHILSGPIEQD